MDTDDLLTAILVIVAIFLLAPLVMMLVAVPTMMGMGFGGMWGVDGGMGLWWLVSGLVPLLIVLGGGYLLYRALRSDGGADPAIEELRAAYARGELTDEEFDARYDRLRRDESVTDENR